MTKFPKTIFLIAAGVLVACSRPQCVVTPLPEQITYKGGYCACDSSRAVVGEFAKLESRIDPSAEGIRAEGYRLQIDRRKILLTAIDSAGLFYGKQTLRQLATAQGIPCVEVLDNPRFAYRGMHLDVSRHFFPKEQIFKILDEMAYYKLNKFHFHLCDNGGWRIQIDKYPLLTKLGSHRMEIEWLKWWDFGDKHYVPEDTPGATYSNAVRHGAFSKEANNFSNQDEAYYDWTITEDREIASGITYKHYSFTNFNQNIYAIEIDMNNPKVTFETVMADEICPNPNGNNNSNNGKILRETLSETCVRRRGEGRNIVVGINTGFFNSHDGFPRGMHIEEGEPVFVNNPYVRSILTNHVWGFTYFDNRTVSFEKRDFTGKFKVGTKEYEYYSVNDTIVRLGGKPSYDANLYTFRYVKEPHPGLTNPIGSKALFIIGRNDQPLKVNSGDFDATVTQIVDGRNATVEAPYVTGKNEWVLQVTGEKADELAQSLKTGDKVTISAELKIGSSTAHVKVHNSSMYRFLYNGVYAAPPKKEDAETINPTTNLGMTQDKSKMIIFCVDGRTDNDRGLDFYEAYRVSQKLGLYDVIRFDGGGSTVMWTYENGVGKVINHVSDSNGERSCMNYLHVRVLE